MPKDKFNQGAYIAQWEKENYFKLLLRLPKHIEEDIRRRAAEQGKSINGYIKDLIIDDITKATI